MLPLVRRVINAPNNQLDVRIAITTAAIVRMLGPPAAFNKCISFKLRSISNSFVQHDSNKRNVKCILLQLTRSSRLTASPVAKRWMISLTRLRVTVVSERTAIALMRVAPLHKARHKSPKLQPNLNKKMVSESPRLAYGLPMNDGTRSAPYWNCPNTILMRSIWAASSKIPHRKPNVLKRPKRKQSKYQPYAFAAQDHCSNNAHDKDSRMHCPNFSHWRSVMLSVPNGIPICFEQITLRDSALAFICWGYWSWMHIPMAIKRHVTASCDFISWVAWGLYARLLAAWLH